MDNIALIFVEKMYAPLLLGRFSSADFEYLDSGLDVFSCLESYEQIIDASERKRSDIPADAHILWGKIREFAEENIHESLKVEAGSHLRLVVTH